MLNSLRASLLLCFLVCCTLFASARTGQVSERIMNLQAKGVRFQTVPLFEQSPTSATQEDRWKEALTKANVLRLIAGATNGLVKAAPAYISLNIPSASGSLNLDLEYTEITTADFRISTASGAPVSNGVGVHYRGMVRGVPGSWAAISVFDGEVMGLFDDGQGESVLGRFEDRRDDLHVLYRERDLRRRNSYTCGTPDDGEPYHTDQLEMASADRTVRCVRYYWEVNHDVFLNKGNVVNTTNYATGLFNQSAILYDNDGIDVTLSELFIWDVPSPYTGPGSGDYLDQFGVQRTSFNGDMAHLLGFGGGGGVAYLNTLCSSLSYLRMAYSGINSSYSNVPTYSWSVEVVTHEQGHNLGSKHTHACAWNGNATAIDGCGPAAGYTEGSCATAPVPTSAVGGTIMSYCHLVSAGIRFQNGFGPQPTAVIVNAVNAASCLGSCGTSCDAPGNLTATSITVNSALLSWSSIGASSYDLQWRQVGAGTWTTVSALTGNTYNLTGLSQGTNYEFQVRSICGASTSAYSTVRTFTTAVPCPDSLEPNNTLGAPANITLPVNISALIAVNGDQDYYRFTLTTTSTINLYLSNLAGDYDLFLLDNTGATLASSEAGGTTNENVNFANAAPGTYFIRVFGYNGAFSATQCYSLNASAFATGCQVPDGVSALSITETTASISWPSVQGASGYELRYRVLGAPSWIDVTGISASPYALNGLQFSTTYEVQVRSVCSGGVQGGTSSNSAFTSSTEFTTLVHYCASGAPLQANILMLLDGPYRSGDQLMIDSLRALGMLPLTEPYTALGYAVDGPTTTTPGVFQVTGPNAIVDWVLVELRAASSPYSVLSTRAALLQRDGDVVDRDGVSPLGFCLASGSYRVSVHHRNHLSCLAGQTSSLTTSPVTIAFDSPSFQAYGTNARRERDGVALLWAGNCMRNSQVDYTGDNSDRDAVLGAIGGVVPTATVTGYRAEDCNMDGQVKYTGDESDRDVILNTIGGVVPTNFIIEQMP